MSQPDPRLSTGRWFARRRIARKSLAGKVGSHRTDGSHRGGVRRANQPGAYHDGMFDLTLTDPGHPLHQRLMGQALAEAETAFAEDEVPVGAVILDLESGQVVAAAHNQREQLQDPTAHAELVAMTQAARAVGSWRLDRCALYVTLEPCPMCASAISLARIRRLYFGASDPKGGGVEHGPRIFNQPTCHHAPEIYGGLAATEAAALLRAFFSARRAP